MLPVIARPHSDMLCHELPISGLRLGALAAEGWYDARGEDRDVGRRVVGPRIVTSYGYRPVR